MKRDEVFSARFTESELPLKAEATVVTREGVGPKAIDEPIGAVLDPRRIRRTVSTKIGREVPYRRPNWLSVL